MGDGNSNCGGISGSGSNSDPLGWVDWHGLKKVNMFKSGERSYCIIGEWADMTDLEAARPKMIATLDTFRDTLEDLGLGVTDPVSGPVVLELK